MKDNTPMHQHIDKNNNICGKLHPAARYHKNNITRLTHDITIIHEMCVTNNYNLAYFINDDSVYREVRAIHEKGI